MLRINVVTATPVNLKPTIEHVPKLQIPKRESHIGARAQAGRRRRRRRGGADVPRHPIHQRLLAPN